MKKDITLSVFFPAYNEEENIAEAVRQAEKTVREITDTYEIIIVDDGSSDKTGKIADQMTRKNDHVRVVHHSPNQGYGAAIWSGIKSARYDYVFFTDADLQFDLSELHNLVRFLPEQKAVLGFRARRKDSFIRRLNAKGWNMLNRFLFGLKVDDIDCAFKLLDRKTVSGLEIKSRGAMMSAEMLIRLAEAGVEFKEVPVTHLPRERGVQTGASPKVILRAFADMTKVFMGELGRPVRTEIARFAGVGLVNTAIDIGAYIILTRFVGFFAANLLLTKGLTFFLGSLFSFTFNRMWTFKHGGSLTVGEFVRFYATVGSSVLVNIGSVFVFHDLLGLNDIVAVVIATGITFVWNFILTKLWVFGNRSLHKTTSPRTLVAAE